MHILIEAIGTRGDVQPSIVLAKGLKAAGHQVSVLASADFHTWIVENGLNALTSRHNIQEFSRATFVQKFTKTACFFVKYATMKKLASTQ